MSFAVESSVIVSIGAVSQVAGGAFLHTNRDAFAVLNIDGWAAGVGDGYACEFQTALERTLQEELSIAGVAREDIDNLAVLIVGIGINAIETLTLHQFDVRAAVAKVCHKATDVVCNGDGSRIAIENNLHGVVLYGTHGKGSCYAGDDAHEKLSHI